MGVFVFSGSEAERWEVGTTVTTLPIMLRAPLASAAKAVDAASDGGEQSDEVCEIADVWNNNMPTRPHYNKHTPTHIVTISRRLINPS